MDQRDSLIRYKIVYGIRDPRIKERKLRDLLKVDTICRAAKTTKHQLEAIPKEPPQLYAHPVQDI